MSIRLEIQTRLRNNPWIMATAWKHRFRLGILQDKSRRRLAEPDDEVVIDGYPRSANTFACDAFSIAQGREVKMGNHFHSPAQFALAAKYRVPAMLVLREPVAAALSWVVFSEGTISAADTLRNYIQFHRPLVRIAGQFVIAPFEEVTTDFGQSIDRLNAHFGTAFARFEHTDESAAEIFQWMEHRLKQREIARGQDLKLRRNYPSEIKDRKRKEYAASFESPRVAGLRAEPDALYRELMASR